MNLSTSERQVMLQALIADKELTSRKLDDLEALIAKLSNAVGNDNDVITDKDRQTRRRSSESRNTYFEKIRQVLFETEGEHEGEFDGLTSREILENMYDFYPEEMDRDDDRKNIATVSAVLYAKVDEKELEVIKKAREQSKFKLVKKLNSALEQFDRDMEQMLINRKKADLIDDDTDLPF